MNDELIENLKEYFNSYEDAIKEFESSGKVVGSKWHNTFRAIRDNIKEILNLDNNITFATMYSKKFNPTMAFYYNDKSKKYNKTDGIYIYITYPNNELKEITISIELGRKIRFTDNDDTYEECIKNIRTLIPKKYKEKFNTRYARNVISAAININEISDFEKILLNMFEIYKIIIKKINETNGKNYEEKYNNFISLISNGKCNAIKIPEKTNSYNTIYYGIPGSGKSYYIKNELLKELKIEEYERIIFYPEYTYSDFVGTYKITSDKENPIKPVAGPFTKMLIKALKNESNNYALIIEEMNRGNAEAIFGDVFQLLDRKNGESEYNINNDFIKECMRQEEIKQEEIKIPKNLFLIATINTSDQNVFNLDTAFGRRWNYIRIDDDFSIEHDEEEYSKKYIKGFINVKWNDFRTSINKAILDPENNIWNREDKQLGLFYISKEQLYSEKENLDIDEEDEIEERKKFVYKVIRYLWFDVFRSEEEKLINVLNKNNLIKELKLCLSFDKLAKQIIRLGETD